MKLNRKVIITYFFFVILYTGVVGLFSSTVHVGYDEELYINLARSFHYDGSFRVGGELVNYSCILYSMIISLAYYLYSPEYILFVMRCINVFIMCSAFFPIYGLAADVLDDENDAYYVAVVTMVLPYMFDTAYIMQEVLAYPLFLWAGFFLYKLFDNVKTNIKRADLICAAFFSASCFFAKTYLLVIPIIVNLILGIYWIKENKEQRRQLFNKILKYDVLYVIFFVAMYWGIWFVNGFEQGNSHYNSMFEELFPITFVDVYWAFLGIIVYLAFTIVNMGILPIETIWTIRLQKENRKKKMWLEDFVLFGIFLMVIEVIILTFSGEQASGNLPYRFSFRFFHIYVPFVFILFVKYYNKLKKKKSWERGISIGAVGVCICYFFYVNNIICATSKQAILDGHLFLLIENITKYIVPYADIIIMLLFLVVLALECMWRKRHRKYPIKLIVAGFILLWGISCVQLPVYNNFVAGGKQIQKDGIVIANCLNENKIEFVYYIEDDISGKNFYLRNFYGYLKQSYSILDNENDLAKSTMSDLNAAVIVRKESNIELLDNGYQKAELETQKLELYLKK